MWQQIFLIRYFGARYLIIKLQNSTFETAVLDVRVTIDFFSNATCNEINISR